ncbi:MULTISPECIES: glutaredoxin 3 [Leeia]|uniref:Glutaredoxin n=1 Tax=Leeia aquatica TaxID=2725557 RepID=A0A847S8V3_9NEIS|nr:glutaredoxin 3 [Leeia aquatica]NLR73789.1 glutaredoxin 3 [Leeia aquatica]
MKTVTMYHTSTCPYCVQAEQLLKRHGVAQITKINIEADDALRSQMQTRTGRRTVPQIFIEDLHVGGFDDLSVLAQQKQLPALLLGAQ